PLAYIVCGWYADSSLDPLGDPNIHSLYEFDATMNTLLWHIDDGEFNEALLRLGDRIKAANLAGLQTLEYTGVEVKPASQLPAGAATSFKAFQVQTSIGAPPSPLDNEGRPVDGSYTTNGAWWPKGSFYHGSVVGIGWPGVG